MGARIFIKAKWPLGFLLLAAPVLARFSVGIVSDREGTIWTNFNFVDTAFHLSIAQALLAAPQFPPLDLNAAGFPLKYHFLADFPLAHFGRLGVPLIALTYWLNLFAVLAALGAVWTCFTAWLRLPARWVLCAGLFFFFINPALFNLLHYLLLSPDYFTGGELLGGVMLFPYFNFENHLNGMLEPQRGLLFSLPVVLAILQVCFGPRVRPGLSAGDSAASSSAGRATAAFAGICLLPLAHVVSFAILVPCLLPRLWQNIKALPRYLPWLVLFFGIGLAQLYYLGAYGPPLDQAYSGWDAWSHMALHDFAILPPPLHWVAFWLAVNGDYFFWGGLFILLAFCGRRLPARVRPRLRPLRAFLCRWRVYFVVCGAAFFIINFYRYAANWGDSNKFVFFLNLGLVLVIAQGAARMGHAARPLWLLFIGLTVIPPSLDFHAKIIRDGARNHLLFHHQAQFAARWLERHLPREARIVTAESVDIHFLSALTRHAVLAGIYSNTNPYVSQSLRVGIREIYETGSLERLRELKVDYLIISCHERTRYELHPVWLKRMNNPVAQTFSIGRPEDHQSVFVFDVKRLVALSP